MHRTLLLAILLATRVLAQDTSVKPGINDRFLAPDMQVKEWVDKFETESREIFHNRSQIISALGLKPGMTVADVGAGTGLFTIAFAEAVGPMGKVYAVDIAPKFVSLIRERAEKAKLTNIVAVLGTDRSIELPENSVDLCFVCDTYHHFEFPKPVLASIYKALKPGGEFVIIDFKRIPGVSNDWVMGHVRAGQEVFESEIAAAGFQKQNEVADILKENYFVRFRKP